MPAFIKLSERILAGLILMVLRCDLWLNEAFPRMAPTVARVEKTRQWPTGSIAQRQDGVGSVCRSRCCAACNPDLV